MGWSPSYGRGEKCIQRSIRCFRAQRKYGEANGITLHGGGTTSPIIADGKVFVSWYRPSGDKIADWIVPPPRSIAINENWPTITRKILADDMLTALDKETGEVVWEVAEKEKGVNRGAGKRNLFSVSPVYHKGNVYSMGSTGRIYAYDAKNGSLIWESSLKEYHKRMNSSVQQSLETKQFPQFAMKSWDAHFKSSLIVVDDILIVPGLKGYDLKTGEVLWSAAPGPKFGGPSIWKHNGKEYLLVSQAKSETESLLRLVSPKTGKDIWTKVIGQNEDPIAIDGDIAIATVKSNNATWGGFRLSLTGAEVIWEFKETYKQTGGDRGPTRRTQIQDGYAVIGRYRKRV